MNQAVVVIADESYLPHAKAVMVNARKLGQWDGDICLVVPPDMNTHDLEGRGIYLHTDERPGFYRKFCLVDDFFRRWDKVVYLDCDVIIQNPLGPLVDACRKDEVLASQEPFTIEHALIHWTPSGVLASNRPLFDNLRVRFDLGRQQFGAGVMVFRPTYLSGNISDCLASLHEEIAPINYHTGNGSDQPVYNLAFYDRFTPVPDNMIAYWALADEGTIVVHTCHMYAPWINKSRTMPAYLCDHLQRPMHDIYLDNLHSFNETFPKQ